MVEMEDPAKRDDRSRGLLEHEELWRRRVVGGRSPSLASERGAVVLCAGRGVGIGGGGAVFHAGRGLRLRRMVERSHWLTV